METVLGHWVLHTLVWALILRGQGHTGPLHTMLESLALPICVAPLGAETEGYTEPERGEVPPTTHTCMGSGTWLEGLHWATIHW